MPAPVVSFLASPTAGVAPMVMVFTDTSINTPTSWLWDFGDGNVSSDQHPVHEYFHPGLFSVRLTATNSSGSSSFTAVNIIFVDIPAPLALPLDGQRTWKMTRDAEGHREYKVVYRVQCGVFDGPSVAINAPGLPTYGSFWQIDNDFDEWAFCLWNAVVTPVVENEPNTFFDIEFTFSTKPPSTLNCKEIQVEDPLLEPARVSGSFVKYQEEATEDRFGNTIETSSHEQLRGPQNEWDRNRLTIRIEQNVASFEQAVSLPGQMIDHVNSVILWGAPVRCVKLSGFSFEKKFFGQCFPYYTRFLEFDINFDTFDRDLLDEGTKALSGHFDATTGAWTLDNVGLVAPDPANPSHFNQFKDRNGENAKVVLDGQGKPSGVTQLGTQISVLSETPISSSNPNEYLLAPVAFGTPRKLRINITDDDSSITDGTVTVTGTDSNGNEISETFDLFFFGTVDFVTQKKFDSVTSILTQNVAGLTGTLDKIEVLGDNTVSQAAKIHVEKYDEADFTLLGIPLVL